MDTAELLVSCNCQSHGASDVPRMETSCLYMVSKLETRRKTPQRRTWLVRLWTSKLNTTYRYRIVSFGRVVAECITIVPFRYNTLVLR